MIHTILRLRKFGLGFLARSTLRAALQHSDYYYYSTAALMASNVSITDSTPEIASSERVMWVLIWYLVILPRAIWLTPVVYSWLRRRHGKTVQTEAASASVISSSEAAMLEAAEQSRRRLHARVKNTLWQAGWMLFWFAQVPFVANAFVSMGATPAMGITEIVGNHRYHWAFAPWAVGLFLATIDPTEAKRISSLLQRRSSVLLGSIGHLLFQLTSLSRVVQNRISHVGLRLVRSGQQQSDAVHRIRTHTLVAQVHRRRADATAPYVAPVCTDMALLFPICCRYVGNHLFSPN